MTLAGDGGLEDFAANLNRVFRRQGRAYGITIRSRVVVVGRSGLMIIPAIAANAIACRLLVTLAGGGGRQS